MSTDREPQPFDRWIDPSLISAPESSEHEVEQLRADLTARRDAALKKFGPLVDVSVDVTADLPRRAHVAHDDDGAHWHELSDNGFCTSPGCTFKLKLPPGWTWSSLSQTAPLTGTCRHCHRPIVFVNDRDDDLIYLRWVHTGTMFGDQPYYRDVRCTPSFTNRSQGTVAEPEILDHHDALRTADHLYLTDAEHHARAHLAADVLLADYDEERQLDNGHSTNVDRDVVHRIATRAASVALVLRDWVPT